MPPGGELVYIQGPLATSSAQRRYAGVREILQGSNVDIFTVNSDWTREGGARAMRDWARVFRKREFPAFIVGAQNDAMAMGARTPSMRSRGSAEVSEGRDCLLRL